MHSESSWDPCGCGETLKLWSYQSGLSNEIINIHHLGPSLAWVQWVHLHPRFLRNFTRMHRICTLRSTCKQTLGIYVEICTHALLILTTTLEWILYIKYFLSVVVFWTTSRKILNVKSTVNGHKPWGWLFSHIRDIVGMYTFCSVVT